MGHKVSPLAFRLGVIRNWNSSWFSDSFSYSDILLEDLQAFKYLDNTFSLQRYCKSQPLFKRWLNHTVDIYTRSYNAENKKGKSLYKIFKSQFLSQPLKKIFCTHKVQVRVIPLKQIGNIYFSTIPITSAELVSQYVGFELKKRNPFNEIMQDIMDWFFKSNFLKGLQISVSGRLKNQNRTKTLWKKKGNIPYSTVSLNVDYADHYAVSKFGSVGIKVWLLYASEKKKVLKK